MRIGAAAPPVAPDVGIRVALARFGAAAARLALAAAFIALCAGCMAPVRRGSAHEALAWRRLEGLGRPVVAVSGIHGDESSGPAGLLAWLDDREGGAWHGRPVVALPTASPEAYALGLRSAPGWSDLNRAFSGAPLPAGDPAPARAREIMGRIAALEPAFVLDFHESDENWDDSPFLTFVLPYEGAGAPGAAALAMRLRDGLGGRTVATAGPAPAGSLCDASSRALGVPALIVEIPEAWAMAERTAIVGLILDLALSVADEIDG